MEVAFETVTEKTIGVYIDTGKQSYIEHYLHLWKNDDPSPYISRSFTPEIVRSEINDDNNAHFLVKMNNDTMGIVKLVLNKGFGAFDGEEALLAEKIYLLKDHSGRGLGKQVLQFIMKLAKRLNKKVVWLDTMKKGRTLGFYQKNGFKIVKETSLKLSNVKISESAMWVLAREL
ncbi:GNAT family N-acetyltransferase [Allomuricauda sp. d1]|uniref:GNAT family N-acetyltransferase n=1 Tax=Allomuricauda sp. d1 TaxID=3136725 RepID=UPI0031E185C9